MGFGVSGPEQVREWVAVLSLVHRHWCARLHRSCEHQPMPACWAGPLEHRRAPPQLAHRPSPFATQFAVPQAKQIRAWGAEGVICGSALVRALGESGSKEEGLRRMADLARSLREVI